MIEVETLGGRHSGAGKSTIIKEYFASELKELSVASDFVYIDSDDIKEQINEFQRYRKAEGDTLLYAALYVHEESTYKADMLIEKCINQKLSFNFVVYFFLKKDIILVKNGKWRDLYDKIFKIVRSPNARLRV